VQHALFPKNPEQKAMIDGISQFGILLLLLLAGMETDLKLVRQTFTSRCAPRPAAECGAASGHAVTRRRS
jgi:Kef-type K+ transport system membrane component KefB